MHAIHTNMAINNSSEPLILDPNLYLDSNFIKENSEWEKAYKAIDWDNNVQSIDTFLHETEKLVIKYSAPNEKIKRGICTCFNLVLTRYPLFFGYWKKFTAISYRLYGLDYSIHVLERSVNAFPHSLELWCDYLNVLVANKSQEYDFIRSKFELASWLVGYHFMAHPFWDKYIEFETKLSAETGEYSLIQDIYKNVCKIPLYHHAKYSTNYRKLIRNLHKDSPELLKMEEESLHKSHLPVQNILGKLWEFESKIKQSFFNLNPLPQNELTNWDNYLKFLLVPSSLLNSSNIPEHFIETVFERCLIPCNKYEHFWIKYLVYKYKRKDANSIKYLSILKRGLSVLPDDRNDTLIATALTCLHNSIFTEGENPSIKNQFFQSYLQVLIDLYKIKPKNHQYVLEYLKIYKLWNGIKYSSHHIDKNRQYNLNNYKKYVKNLETLLQKYFSKSDYHRTLDIDVRFFRYMLNDNSIDTVIVELIKVRWFVFKETLAIKKIFATYWNRPQLKNSVKFWLLYYKFQKKVKDFDKLASFFTRLGEYIFLPTLVINDMLEDYKTFVLLNGNLKDITKKSEDFWLTLDCKRNDPMWSKNKIKRNWTTKRYKSAGHAGILVERPESQNSVIHRKVLKKNSAQELPTLKVPHHMNNAIKPINYFTTDYLQQYGGNTKMNKILKGNAVGKNK
ncbi:Prp39p SCDLUD_000444 [Saccharomycodes ludwigii]|uniref:Prp39p n=1 Tax=Saccharomycodes ludwigii TaxID=36035 RepID=UPI001E8AB661|nr:hypothetical protein SCDLUD_000444 [Saccharomycodes ludwigii]KAH3902851.1 hypothetical protein SCDLUD_000444 [Saccharomycodes ludwigii]